MELSLPRLSDFYVSRRNRVLGSSRFQRWAAAFPMTRPIARRQAQGLFDLCAGFVYSQVLLACVQLGLFDLLRAGPQSRDALVSALGLSDEATDRLLSAAVSLKLVDDLGEDRFALGPKGAMLAGNDGLVEMIKHHEMFYKDLTNPVALLRGQDGAGTLSKYWSYARTENAADLSADAVTPYSGLMSKSSMLVTQEALAAYPFHRHRVLLDVGGGEGCFLQAAANHAKDLKVMLFDLPSVVANAKSHLSALSREGRVTFFAGDFFKDSLPSGADLITLVRIIHDHDDPEALKILKAVRRVLPKDGSLLIVEPMSGTPGAQTVADAYFGLYLWAMGQGRPRQPDQIMSLLAEAGFSTFNLVKTKQPMLTSLIRAQV